MTPQAAAPPTRSRVTFDEIEGFRITIPVEASCPEAAVTVGGFLVWALGEVILVGMLLIAVRGTRHVGEASIPHRAVMAAGWTALGVAAAIWGIPWAGRREVIGIDGDRLTIRRETSRSSQADSYALARVRNLRYSPPVGLFDPGYRASATPVFAGNIAFDYDGSTIRFGPGLSETECRRLIRTVKDRYKIQDDRDEPLPVERL